jgi:hypothetical protein
MIATRDSAGTELMARSFVAPQDSMFARIVREREAWYSNLTIAGFEAAAASRFELVKSLEIDGLYRCLYLFRQRHART